MRRKDREVTDQAEIRKFIEKERVMRVGFCDEGDIYIVPVNYGWELCLCFPRSQSGKKI